LRIILNDERGKLGERREFYSEEGVGAFVRELSKESDFRTPLEPLVFEQKCEEHNIWVQVAMQWTDNDGKMVYGYANNIRTTDGGRHVDGLENIIPRLINKFGKETGVLKEKDATLTKADCLAGLVSVVSVRVVQPQFQGQTKDRLMTPAAEPAVAAVAQRFLTEFFEKNPNTVKSVVERALLAQRVRIARNKASDTVKRQSFLGGRLPGKLTDCEMEDNQFTELFFVEGDSAGGGAKQARDPVTQAILPLKGKIINVEKNDIEKLLANAEVQAIITAVGTGIGDAFDITKRRYDKLIFMSVVGSEMVMLKGPDGSFTTTCGAFIDQCVEGDLDETKFEIACFDQSKQETVFRPIKKAIRHESADSLIKIRTQYGRSVTVTGGHSVFTVDADGNVGLKCGNELQIGDHVLSPSKLPRAAIREYEFDLLKILRSHPQLSKKTLVYDSSVSRIRLLRRRSSSRPNVAGMDTPRVAACLGVWDILRGRRVDSCLSAPDVAESVGVSNGSVIHSWEKQRTRPRIQQFRKYLRAIGAQWPSGAKIVLSDVEQTLALAGQSANEWNRKTASRAYLHDFTDHEMRLLSRTAYFVPSNQEQHLGSERFLRLDHDLAYFLGWFAAEGSLSKSQVSLSLTEKDLPFVSRIALAVKNCFGCEIRPHADSEHCQKFYFNSPSAAALIREIGLGAIASSKRLPNFLFDCDISIAQTFLNAYFLGDGTITADGVSITTASLRMAEDLRYLLLQFGICGPFSVVDGKVTQIRGRETLQKTSYRVQVCSKQMVEKGAFMWLGHWKAPWLRDVLEKTILTRPRYLEVSETLIGLKIDRIEVLPPHTEKVYDFSVAFDENFICGGGGLCCHNTDADDDGLHIRTLLLVLFQRFMPQLIEAGHIYIAQPPLYKLESRNKKEYLWDDKDLAKAKSKYGDKAEVTRFKGLGEMNPDELGETTMEIGKRRLLQVTMLDKEEAARITQVLMGSNPAARKEHIIARSAFFKVED
jgi:DNA gyrase subunit B